VTTVGTIKSMTNLYNVRVGHKVKVHNKRDNVVFKAGKYEGEVVKEDGHSFGVKIPGDWGDEWWFHRSSGHSYTGDAEIIEVIL
jgi:hypothetical protein